MLAEDEDLLRPIVQIAVQEFLEAEMNEALGTGKSERSAGPVYLDMQPLREALKPSLQLAA